MTEMDIQFASALIAFTGVVAALAVQLVRFNLPPELEEGRSIRAFLEYVNYIVSHILNFAMLFLTPFFAWSAWRAVRGVVENNREAIWDEAASSAQIGIIGLLIIAIIELLFWSLGTFVLVPLYVLISIERAARLRA